MNETQVKGIFVTVVSIAMATIGIVAIPIILLLLAIATDYITGVLAAKYRGQKISSEVGKKGIIKKIGLIIIVAACLMLDILIIYGSLLTSIKIPLYFIVTCIVSVIMLFNELISICENIKDMGVNIPGFLIPLMKNIRSKVEEKAVAELKGEDEG